MVAQQKQDRFTKNRQEILAQACKTGNPFLIVTCIGVFFWTELLWPVQETSRQTPAE
jgi:hypothetical protein